MDTASRDRGAGRAFIAAIRAAAGDPAAVERVLRMYAGATIYLPATRDAERRRAARALLDSGIERAAAVARLAARFDVTASTARRWIARELAQDSKADARALRHAGAAIERSHDAQRHRKPVDGRREAAPLCRAA